MSLLNVLKYKTLILNSNIIPQNQNTEKIAFNVFQMKFLAMHISNPKLSFNTFTVGNLQYILMEHDLYLISK